MAQVRYPFTLSTTEPNNYVGIVKVRNEDTGTQVFEIEIVENGQIKTFQGLTPYFVNKTKLDQGMPVEERAQVSYPTQGRVEYTLHDRDLQWLGVNKAYLSFRNEDGIEKFSTKDFEFRVVGGIYKSSFNGEAYSITLEELINEFKKGLANSTNDLDQFRKDWEKFVQENKDILESVDPNGELLNQLNDLKKQQEELAELRETYTLNTGLQIGGGMPRKAFQSALDQMKAKIDASKFNILHMTDVHTDYGFSSGGYKYAEYFFSHMTNMQYLQDVADCTIYNGDNADCYLADKEQSEIQQRKFSLKALRNARIPTFINVGNHDNGSFTWNREYSGKVFPKNIITNEEFKDFYSTKERLFDEVRNVDSLYFYKDFPNKKIRVIGINTNDNNQTILNSDGSYKYGSHDHFAMQQEQLKWLAEKALKIPVGYQVIMFGHCPLQEEIFDNRECLINIIEAFMLGTSKRIQSVYPDHEVDFTSDFTSQGPSTFVGYICGHWHDEGINKFGASKQFTQIRCLNSCFTDPMQIDLLTEDAWSVLSIDSTAKKVSVIGFGRATDREFSY